MAGRLDSFGHEDSESAGEYELTQEQIQKLRDLASTRYARFDDGWYAVGSDFSVTVASSVTLSPLGRDSISASGDLFVMFNNETGEIMMPGTAENTAKIMKLKGFLAKPVLEKSNFLPRIG